ncbi:hypothetical protein GLA29479_4658 [Lysobacter antibioticus]|nr:hypothetical protein GLA29479_4658 [Lysobacter antibioticus]
MRAEVLIGLKDHAQPATAGALQERVSAARFEGGLEVQGDLRVVREASNGKDAFIAIWKPRPQWRR